VILSRIRSFLPTFTRWGGLFAITAFFFCLGVPLLLQRAMGSGASKTEWRHSPSEGAAQRKFSKSGYDVTPLTPQEIDTAAKSLTPFQK